VEGSCPDFGSYRFEPLPESATETKRIVTLWNSSVGDGNGKGPAVHLTGTEATEAAFKGHAGGQRVLHIATHGFFLGGNCAPFREPGSRGMSLVRPAPGGIDPGLKTSIPMVLSGLALAGANHRGAAGRGGQDGVLTAEEILGLNLEGVEWAVLSACDTGLGTVQAGEGVIGLQRAFQMAGAQTVIMSLWTVDDEWTRHWMEELYRGRLAGDLSTAEAVRAAALATLRKERAEKGTGHPFYWASFIATGNWN
jgi:CHAT domain-containing protein